MTIGIADIDKVLKQREITHGTYHDKTIFIQLLKDAIRYSAEDGWENLDPDMKESLDMICTKIGRILYGDPTHIDSWIDITGYSQLIVNRLQSLATKPTKSKQSSKAQQ